MEIAPGQTSGRYRTELLHPHPRLTRTTEKEKFVTLGISSLAALLHFYHHSPFFSALFFAPYQGQGWAAVARVAFHKIYRHARAPPGFSSRELGFISTFLISPWRHDNALNFVSRRRNAATPERYRAKSRGGDAHFAIKGARRGGSKLTGAMDSISRLKSHFVRLFKEKVSEKLSR